MSQLDERGTEIVDKQEVLVRETEDLIDKAGGDLYVGSFDTTEGFLRDALANVQEINRLQERLDNLA